MMQPKPAYNVPPKPKLDRHAEVSQYMRLRELFTYEQIEQLATMCREANENAKELQRMQWISVAFDKGHVQDFILHKSLKPAKPVIYLAE